MKLVRTVFIAAAAISAAVIVSPLASAQNLSTDARKVGMGGAGDAETIASKLDEEQQSYRSIPLPLGLIQVYKNRTIFNPDNDAFDPVRAMEYAADPLHTTLRRNSATKASEFVKDLSDADFQNINTYRGFKPSPEIEAAGLLSPTWGKTFRFSRNKEKNSYQGIYVGVGPYISIGTHLVFDPNLLAVLASSTDTTTPGTYHITDASSGQGAVAITGGYRTRLPLFQKLRKGASREGLYFAANYHYLHGLHFDDADLAVNFSTESDGNITPTAEPVRVDRTTSKAGRGFALDFATALVTKHWNITVGVDGVGNRITWKDLRGETYALTSVTDGSEFVHSSFTPAITERRFTLPVRYSGSGAYHADRWSAAAELAQTLQGFIANVGGEYLWKRLAFRGGGRYSKELWHPAAGIGLNLTQRIGVDVAALQNTSNIEEDRRTSFAVSLRLNKKREK